MARLKKQIGIVDLGSNSVRLIAVEYTPGFAFQITTEFSRRVRLSEGMAGTNLLQPHAIERTLDTLRVIHEMCDARGIKRIVPVATAAVRDATNRQEFLKAAQKKTGLRFRVLTGEEEAALGVLAVINGLGVQAGIVMEIGGGSMQVSEVRHGKFQHGLTAPLGAVRLTEQFLPSDPVDPLQLSQLVNHIAATLQPLEWMQAAPGERLVVVGGTARSLAVIDRELRGYPIDLINGYELELARLSALIEQVRALPIKDRKKYLPGLKADRADIILAGALVLEGAMLRAGVDRATICSQGVREGLFYQEFLKQRASPLIPNLREFSVLNLRRLHGAHLPDQSPVAQLALDLFNALEPMHGYQPPERELLWAAAQLLEIGADVDFHDPARHSAYLVLNSGLPGYSHREIALISLLDLAQRPAGMAPATEAFGGKEAAVLASRLSVILRLAAIFAGNQLRAVKVKSVERQGDQLLLRFDSLRDLAWELAEAKNLSKAFEEAFGCGLLVVSPL